jgi:hypothetical protein
VGFKLATLMVIGTATINVNIPETSLLSDKTGG